MNRASVLRSGMFHLLGGENASKVNNSQFLYIHYFYFLLSTNSYCVWFSLYIFVPFGGVQLLYYFSPVYKRFVLNFNIEEGIH